MCRGLRVFLHLFDSGLEFFLVDDALLAQKGLYCSKPVLIVARLQVMEPMHALDGVAKLGAVIEALGRYSALHGEHDLLPLLVEDGLIVLWRYGTRPLHATHIVYAVHPAPPVRLRLF